MMEMALEYHVPRTPLSTGGAGAIVDDELRLGVEAGVQLGRNAIVPLVPVNTGILRQGVQVSVSGSGVERVGRIFNPIGHAPPVEHGSRPHWPPRGPLELWVRRKLGISEAREVRSVAFVIARAISRRGTPARRMFGQGFARAKAPIMARLRLALRRAVTRIQAGA